ncbi:MAG TPA: tetratricopeptide repeat protein [Pyrinomonadaceae bacterium]
MFLPTGRAIAQGRGCRFLQALSLILFLSFASAAIYAQGGIDSTGTGGKHKIQGRIYFPSGRRSDATAVKVTLESTSSESLSLIADLNGSFTFNSIAPGSYTLTVDAGKDYEIGRESVYIDGTPRNRTLSGADIARADVPRIFNVIVTLRLKRGAGSDSPGVVDAALANLPKPAVDAYQRALESARSGDNAKAIEQLKDALRYYPDFALALNELGVQYLKVGQADKAAEAFRSALRIKPDEFMPRLNYGIALLENRNPAEAEAQLRQALKKNDSSWTAHMYLGIVLIKLRNYDEAEKELARTLEIAGDNLGLPHYYLGGIYWHKGELRRAADELEKYLRLAPKAPDAERVRATIKDLRSKQG